MDNLILSKGATLFNGDVRELKLVGGFSNNVFECNRNGEIFILKFYLSTKYKKESVKAELDWISYLHKSGVNVTAPLPSINGKKMEIIRGNNNEECYVLAFEKANGAFIDTSNTDKWNEKFFYNWGKTLGKLHSLSKTYKPSGESIKKQEWNKGLLFTSKIDGISKVVAEKWNTFISDSNKLPKDIHSYGMIHNDLHQKNFYLDDEDIILFDFGDCEYNWFVYDIAIVIYHALQTIDENNIQGR
ncbi:phosphotransferase enzyme family protein, partial [Oceanobacillus damuensis]|uniref:phosphotransferase enzyme family protein n=1 Tax=Oceanobacillus damuensis TaxID=937928 RepID=UPI000833338D